MDRDVVFSSAENNQRAVVVAIEENKNGERMHLIRWMRPSEKYPDGMLVKTGYPYAHESIRLWNVNFIEGKMNPKCCDVGDFPIVIDGKHKKGTNGAWVIGEYADGRLKLLSVSGRTKIVTQATALDFHQKFGIANAVVEGGKLAGKKVPFIKVDEHGAAFDKYATSDDISLEYILNNGEVIDSEVIDGIAETIYIAGGLLYSVDIEDSTQGEVLGVRAVDVLGDFKGIQTYELRERIKKQFMMRGSKVSPLLTEEQYKGYDRYDLLDAEDVKEQHDANKAAGYGMDSEELMKLCNMHEKCKPVGDYRTMLKIEYRLDDANFHSEASMLHNGDYAGVRKVAEDMGKDTQTLEEITGEKQVYKADGGYLPASSVQKAPSKIAGMTFCVTGRVDFPGKRAALQDFIRQRGGFPVDKVTYGTSYLITNDPNSGSKKNKDARQFMVPVISEAEFMRMAGV